MSPAHTPPSPSLTSTATAPTPRPARPAPTAHPASTADVRPPARRRRRLTPGRRLPYARCAGPLLLLAGWVAASALGALDPRVLPAPWTVLATAYDLTVDGRLTEHLSLSLRRAGSGLALGVAVGVVLAALSGLSRLGESLIDGTMQVKRAIPALALLPLLILWWGVGEQMKVLTIALGVMVHVYINTYAALTGIDSRYVELAEALGLSRTRFLARVVVPGALPGFFVGLRLAVTASWLGLVVVEQVNATSGIGYMMFQAQMYAQTDVILVGLLLYGTFGFASDALVRLVERRALAWRRTLAD